MLVKFLNYRGDGYVAVNPEYIVALEEVSGGVIFIMGAIETKIDGNYRSELLNRKVFTSESIESVCLKLGIAESEEIPVVSTPPARSRRE